MCFGNCLPFHGNLKNPSVKRSLKGLARASFQELRQFLPRRQAESVVAALSMSVIAETEHARAEQLDNPESIYRACADMKLFNQEVLRVILLDTRYRHISTVEITKGSINESLAYPRDIFRPVIRTARALFTENKASQCKFS